MAFTSALMLAPLRTVAELTVAFAGLMMVLAVGIYKIPVAVVVVVRVVIVTIVGIISRAAGEHEPDQYRYSIQNRFFDVHSNHSLSVLNLTIPSVRYKNSQGSLERMGYLVSIRWVSRRALS
jgi:hypothetical protein